MHKPGIQTAIPRRRYRLGEFTVTVLGDVDSNDGIDYRYIAAVIQGQDPEPGIYLTAEREAGGGYAMRLVMRDGAEVIGSSDQWGDLDAFVNEVLNVVAQVLSLTDETPYQLM
jgi:hypothetical protein